MQRKKVWRRGATAVAVVALLAAGFFAVRRLTPPVLEDQKVTQSLEEAWAGTIQKFGIEPVFPPEEDLSVGDILAVVVADNEADPNVTEKKVDRGSPFLKRSVKLAHVDVRKQLRDAYAMLPVFTSPLQAVVKAGQDQAGPPPPHPGVNREFDPEVLQSNLPRAAFPSLKIQGINSAAAGLSGGGRGSADYGRSNQGLEEIHLTEVRAYGLPSVRALELLKAYCMAEKTKGDCLEETARWHLRQIVGDRINNKYVDDQGNNRFAMTIEIVMVNRVYLTRSIAHVRRSSSSQGGGLSAARPAPASPPKPAPAARSGSEGTEQEALKKRLEEVEAQLAGVRAGGTLVFASMSGNEVMLQEEFDRPVAIGYRSVRYDFGNEETSK
ncbi:MAG TPA: hypothetical protein VF601_00260 [Beijerinckiaceae bacterium]|jgi:hypothetical protein